MLEADVAIVGAGAAGLSLAHRLSRRAPGEPRLSVILLDAPPGPLRPLAAPGASGRRGPARTTRLSAPSGGDCGRAPPRAGSSSTTSRP